jgi:hypothetical protein
MTDDHFDTVLAPVLRGLSHHLDGLVVIGGWVPELHRRFGPPGEWAVRPLHTTEVDVLAPTPGGTDPHAPSISAALAAAGFTPVTQEGPSAVWERDAAAGERIEFFVEHRGAWSGVSQVVAVEPGGNLGGLALEGVGVLRDHSVVLPVPLGTAAGREELVLVRVPELGAFALHKGVTFLRRRDRAKRIKDLHYIVDIMQSGDGVVEVVERQVLSYCAHGGAVAALARTARNYVGLAVGEGSGAELMVRLGEALALRHGMSPVEGRARARGYLTDFVELIPERCG